MNKSDLIEQIDILKDGEILHRLTNKNEEKKIQQIIARSVDFDNGNLDFQMAQKCLDSISKIVAKLKNKGPIIPILNKLEGVEQGQYIKVIVHYKITPGLKDRVLDLDSLKSKGELLSVKEKALSTFNEVMDLLEAGFLRTAQMIDGRWTANEWVKKAILLGFSLGDMIVYNSSSDINFTDKDTFPLRSLNGNEGFRVVPPGAGLRRGAYAGKNCIFMPPAYANVGAHIGGGTMVENLAGSCSQIGRDSHISAGAIIGGVLDPIEATPVILGDQVLMGEGSGVTQGARLGDLVTIAPGVHISKATPILDPLNNLAYTSLGRAELITHELAKGIKTYSVGKVIEEKDSSYGPEVPHGALVIPSMSLSSRGTFKLTPLIAKYIKNSSERAYALEEALRN